LLALARAEKVDITRISILALAEQYLAFIERVHEVRLEIAADYLVMAAWLAYLKSRLLLPDAPDDEGPTGEELAADLAFRLRRLEAMRAAAGRLANRDRLGRDVFARGAPEPIVVQRLPQFQATLYDLLAAYAARRQERATAVVRVRARPVLVAQGPPQRPCWRGWLAAWPTGCRMSGILSSYHTAPICGGVSPPHVRREPRAGARTARSSSARRSRSRPIHSGTHRVTGPSVDGALNRWQLPTSLWPSKSITTTNRP